MNSQAQLLKKQLSNIIRGLATTSHTAVLIIFVLLWVRFSPAQDYIYETGSPVFSVAQPVPFGFVNLANGNPHLEIPIASAPQRGKLNFTAKLVYDGRIWQIVKIGGSLMWKPTNVPNSIAGWRFVTTADPGMVTFTTLSDQDCAGNQNKTSFTTFVWQDPGGTRRKFNLFTAQDPGCPDDVSTADGYALDSSGYHMFITNYNQAVVFAKDGTQVFPTVQDTNGNYFSTDANGNVVDTLGRTLVKKTVSGNQTFYDVLNSQGTTSRFTLTTGSILVNTGFSANQSGITDDQENITVVSSLGLPNGDTYTFNYDAAQATGEPGFFTAGYGLLSSITHSAMGQIERFGYESFIDAFGVVNRWATNTADSSINYVSCPTPSPGMPACQTAKLTRTGGTVSYIFSMQPGGAWNTTTTALGSDGSFIMSATRNYDFSQSCNGCPNPVFVTLQNVRTTNGDFTAQTAYSYDSPSSANVTLVQQWNYYKGDATTTPPATPDHQTVIAYSPDPGLIANHITNRVSSITEQDGSGNQVAQTQYSYDTTALTQLSGTIANLNTGVSSHRGNLTQISRWTGGTSFLTAGLTYDSSGQLVQVKDPAGNIAKISYTDKFFTDNGQNPPTKLTPNQPTNAYPTSITVPDGTVTLGYYYGSGKPALATDLNNQNIYEHYIDSLDRLTQVIAPKGWEQMAYTTLNIVDLYAGITDATPSTSCSGCFHEQSVFDAFGHLAEDTLLSDPAGSVVVGYLRDIYGNVLLADNPSRTPATAGQTFITYDVLYRPTQKTNPDGSVAKIFYGSPAKQLCSSATYGFGTFTLVTDEMGRRRQVLQDAFGRIIEADEADATGALTVPTCYQYNTAGELTQVVQGGLTRSYQYDPLWRVTQVTTPEGGIETYSYLNDDGTLCSGDPSAVCKLTDARGIATRYQYDTSGRLTRKTYSDGTPTAVFNYNETSAQGISLANTLGQLSSMATQDANGKMLTGEIFSYDAAGNIVNNAQCTPQNCGTSVFRNNYTFDLLGNVTNINNSWGRNLTMAVNNAAQITSLVASQSDATHPATLLENTKYNDFGSLISATLGNGLQEVFGFSKVTGNFNSARVGPDFAFATPAAGNTAAPGAGSITISGAVRQATTTGVPGTATLTLTGVPRQVTNGTQPPSPSTVNFTIAGTEQVSQTVEDATAAAGTGTVEIDGALQVFVKRPAQAEASASAAFGLGGPLGSTQVQTGSAGLGSGSFSVTSITSNGNDRTAPGPLSCQPTPPKGLVVCNPTTISDTGKITVSINGFTAQVFYNGSSNTSNLASALASALSASGSPVTASFSGSTVTMTAINAGAATNYSWSSTSATNNSKFSGTSFPLSPVSGALSGGHDPALTTVYDTGTVTVSFSTNPMIDLYPKSYSATATYGNGPGQDSSTTAIAADLSQQLAAQGSPVRLAASGSGVQVVAPPGSAGNQLVITCLASTNSPNFTTPSFTCPSQTNFRSGIDDLTVTTYDSGTVSLNVGNFTANATYAPLSSSAPWSVQAAPVSSLLPSSLPASFLASATLPYHMFYIDGNRQIHDLSQDSIGNWHDQNIMALTGVPGDGGLSLSAFYVNFNSTEHVFYLDQNLHVHEQFTDSSGNWHDQDNSAASNAPKAASLSGLAALSGSAFFPEHLFYADANGHIHEQYSDTNGAWHDQDNTNASGSSSVACSNSLGSLSAFYWPNSSFPEHVFYIDSNGDIHEQYSDSTGHWHDLDVTVTTGASRSFCTAGLSSLLVQGGAPSEHLLYQSAPGTIHHAWLDSTGWHDEDTGAHHFTPGLTAMLDGQSSPHVFHVPSDGDLHHVWKDFNGWHDQDLGTTAGPGPMNWNGVRLSSLFDGYSVHVFNGGSQAVSGNSLASLVASALTRGLTTGTSPVIATASGNKLQLLARTTGAVTDYSLSVSSTYNNTFFTQPSFTGANAASMAGGMDSADTPLYDSGTISLSINNHLTEIPWGLTATPQSIASELKRAINLDAGNPVTAQLTSGNVITLTSKAVGANTNYPITANITFDSGDFSNASFGAEFDTPPQPTNMHGGRDANGTVWDTGSIVVSINGITKTVPYDQNSESGALERAIVNAFNSDPNSSVWACTCLPATTGTITFTAKKPGNSTNNYSISATSATNNVNFTGTSFPVSVSGPTLTGGADSGGSQATVSDTGVVSLKVGSFTASVNYGSTTTSSSSLVCCGASDVASALANILNQSPNSPVVAAANGGQLSLTSRTGGSLANYSFSASPQTNDSTDFPNASFSFSPASGSLTGGTDKANASNGSSSIAAIAINQIGPWPGSSEACPVRLDIFVNGYDYSTCIGPSTSSTAGFASQVAQSINQLNAQPQVPGYVSATASGSTVYLQSRIGGFNTNYPIQAVIRIFDPAFLSPISVTVSGPAMTGGTDNAGMVYALDVDTDPSGTVAGANDSINGNWTYLYDPLGRIEEAFTPTADYAYDYDIYGNRLHQTPANGGNALSLVYVNNRISATGVQYDASGNMISDGNHTYGYDAENRLISVDGGQTASYMYSADGLRVRTTVGSNFTDFIHDAGGETVGILGANGALIRQEIGGFATLNSSGTYFHHRDLLGNLRVITDQTGTVQQTCTNLPYGDALSCAAGSITPLNFTGYARDSETNLDFANARHYSSQFGRFMSPDPLGGDVGNPQSLNRYAYVLNSPLSAIDPSGLDGCVIVNGVANCVVTSGGGGGGGGGPFGGGGGPFGGGASGGGGGIDLCSLLDCGFAGVRLPPPPSAGQLAAEQSFFRPAPISDPFQFLLGSGEELTVNAFVDFATMIDNMRQFSFGGPDFQLERNRIRASSHSEQTGMLFGSFAGFLIPGDEEGATASFVERIFANPKLLAQFNTEAHAIELGQFLEQQGWKVTKLGSGAHAGQGMRALEFTANGVKTDRAIMWHPGGGHHGPSSYWKISSGNRGVIRVGPQFP